MFCYVCLTLEQVGTQIASVPSFVIRKSTSALLLARWHTVEARTCQVQAECWII